VQPFPGSRIVLPVAGPGGNAGSAAAEGRAISDEPKNEVAPALADEADLVHRAQADPEAFGTLYETHYQTVLNYLYRLTLSVALAEQLTSNTFFKALRGLPTYRPRPHVPFRSWLYRIATNEARMHWRARKGSRETPLPPDENDLSRLIFASTAAESPEEVQEKQRRFALIHRALARLSDPYQEVLTLRYFEGLALEEIAGVLEKPLGTVKSLVHRGLARLSAAVTKLDATE
jgi:RNA polymerase sigma-70 factor (ECF subfamily)